ncbi:carbohydrate ABC transporter permease [Bauldia sp.]|uniref:carbohydrate ABC transporter permease n=1 Tax=Bauldia sp. TaxID=2575872 RepID=UPI003BAC2CCC
MPGRQYVISLIAILILALYLFPIYWMYVTSFKPISELSQYPPTLWPQHPESNHVEIFENFAVARYFWNSIVITAGVTFITVVVGTGTAYGLALVRNRFVEVVLFTILLLQALPSSLMATPLFVLFNVVGLLQSPRLAVILAATAKSLPFFIVICRAAFLQIPKELRDAGLVDGNSRVGVFFRIALPLARNSILITAVLIAIQAMGEYVFSLSFIAQIELQPLTLGLNNFIGANQTDWNGVMVFASILVTPILFVFVFLQRRIISGLTAGALK